MRNFVKAGRVLLALFDLVNYSSAQFITHPVDVQLKGSYACGILGW